MKKFLIIFLLFSLNIFGLTYGVQLELVNGDSTRLINVDQKIKLVQDEIHVIKNPVLKKSFKVVELSVLLDVDLINKDKITRLISDDKFFVDLKIQPGYKPFVDLDKFEKTSQVDLVYKNGKHDMRWIKNLKRIEIINDTNPKSLMIIPGENIYNDVSKKLRYEKSMMENLLLLSDIFREYNLAGVIISAGASSIINHDLLATEREVIYSPENIIKRVNEINSKEDIKYIVIRLMNCDCKNYILNGKDYYKLDLFEKDEYIYTHLYEIAYIKWIQVHYLFGAHQKNL